MKIFTSFNLRIKDGFVNSEKSELKTKYIKTKCIKKTIYLQKLSSFQFCNFYI